VARNSSGLGNLSAFERNGAICYSSTDLRREICYATK
jgi:hypothetical protein